MTPEETDMELGPGALEADRILVRSLCSNDLEAMVRIDQKIVGRSRHSYLETKLRDALEPGALKISLAAEDDGALVGFLLASLYYGEFGVPEPVAVLDTIAVDPPRWGQNFGAALLRQLVTNLRALKIDTIRTEVAWDQLELMGFLARQGFEPSKRICLELDLRGR